MSFESVNSGAISGQIEAMGCLPSVVWKRESGVAPNNTLHATGIAPSVCPWIDRSIPSVGSPVRELHRWATSDLGRFEL